MSVAAPQRRYRTVGAALAAAGAVAVTASPAPVAAPVTGQQPVRLVAGESLLNIPANLFQALVNIPATEVQAMNTLAGSLFFTGNWYTPSATNLWGEDPGDPGHFMALADILIPFKAISGLGTPEIDPEALAAGHAGLGQQLAMLSAVQLPVNGSCDAESCAPMVPTAPITGITAIDRWIWFLSTWTGMQQMPLFKNWFPVPVVQMTEAYHFGEIVNPSAGVGPGGSVPGADLDAIPGQPGLPGFGFPGTILGGPDGTDNLVPWSNLDFKLDLAWPFQNFLNSLMAPVDPDGFETVTLEQVLRSLQAVTAGLIVAFDPYVAGSPTCVLDCTLPPAFTTEGLVRSVADAWPGNPLVDQWLAEAATGTANGATQQQIDFAIDFLQGQQQSFDFGNPLPEHLAPGIENLITFMQDSGVQSLTHQLADFLHFDPANNPGGWIEGVYDAWLEFIKPFL